MADPVTLGIAGFALHVGKKFSTDGGIAVGRMREPCRCTLVKR